jgi:myo-inositol-1-phosphate synthase
MIGPSAYFKKSPPIQYPDDVARAMVEEFIQKYGHKQAKPAKKKETEKRARAPRSGMKKAARRSA